MHLAAKPLKPTIPPVSQRSFFDEQSRHRTRAKASAILIGIVGCLMVWGFGFVVFAALIFYTSFLSRLLPHQVTGTYAAVMHYVGGPVGVSALAALFTAGLWWFANRILISDTSAGLIWRIRARLPDPAEPVDQLAADLVEEIAATAATRAPVVLVYEGPHVNAAVIGDQPEGAGILVSRELLNTLGPDERRAVIAHLVASEVNGDLQLTAALLRVYYMIGISVTLLDLPFSSGARKAMALLWRYARQSDPESIAALGEELGAALTRSLHPDGLESLTLFTRKMIGEEKDVRSIVTTVLLVPLLPFLVLRLAAGITFGLTALLLTGPLVTLLLRSRRQLADATAVQLTQNPQRIGSRIDSSLRPGPRFSRSRLVGNEFHHWPRKGRPTRV